MAQNCADCAHTKLHESPNCRGMRKIENLLRDFFQVHTLLETIGMTVWHPPVLQHNDAHIRKCPNHVGLLAVHYYIIDTLCWKKTVPSICEGIHSEGVQRDIPMS